MQESEDHSEYALAIAGVGSKGWGLMNRPTRDASSLIDGLWFSVSDIRKFRSFGFECDHRFIAGCHGLLPSEGASRLV